MRRKAANASDAGSCAFSKLDPPEWKELLPKVGYKTPLRQAGITFLICYVGLGPSSDIYKSLWRFWGIVLGVRTAGFVFLFWWPESASDETIESLKKLMRTTLAVGKETAQGKITEERLVAIERRLSANLLEVLTMADQARLEGRSGSSYSTVGIEAATTLFGSPIVLKSSHAGDCPVRKRFCRSRCGRAPPC